MNFERLKFSGDRDNPYERPTHKYEPNERDFASLDRVLSHSGRVLKEIGASEAVGRLPNLADFSFYINPGKGAEYYTLEDRQIVGAFPVARHENLGSNFAFSCLSHEISHYVSTKVTDGKGNSFEGFDHYDKSDTTDIHWRGVCSEPSGELFSALTQRSLAPTKEAEIKTPYKVQVPLIIALLKKLSKVYKTSLEAEIIEITRANIQRDQNWLSRVGEALGQQVKEKMTGIERESEGWILMQQVQEFIEEAGIKSSFFENKRRLMSRQGLYIPQINTRFVFLNANMDEPWPVKNK